MVMDILDTLNHPTYFHEFVILSGDADFTPALLRLRKHERFTAALSVGYVSPAYKAACDYVITQDTFVRDALGVTLREEDVNRAFEEREVSEVSAALLNRMADRLYEVANYPDGIQASDLPDVYKAFHEFRNSNHWLGFYSLRRLTEAMVNLRDDLVIIEEDPWRVARVSVPEVIQQVSAARPEPGSEAAKEPPVDIKASISGLVRGAVEGASAPVALGTLAQAVSGRFGEYLRDTAWLGAGSFKALLQELDLGPLKISQVGPGYVYDPSRQDPGLQPLAADLYSAAPGNLDEFTQRYPDLAPLAYKIHQLTDTPYLMPEHYALLFQEIARDINERGYQMTRTSKTVRDRCVERGAPVARSHVNFVLIGISYTGYRFGGEQGEDPVLLGDYFVKNVESLCQTAQVDLTEADYARIRYWVMGMLPQPA
jgi:hypothetical protein